MNNNNNKFQFKHHNLLTILALVGLSKLIKFSLIVGSICTFFSMINIVGPLTVVFNGLPGGLFCLLLTSLWHTKALVGFSLLGSSGLPNFLAGLYWRSTHLVFKIGLPSLSMLLFWYQTWGTVAMAYALLWCIPILITILKVEQTYLKALAATFVAHSVGSVLWVYGANLTANQWVALIPVALCERIFLAILMGSVYNLVQAGFPRLSFNNKLNLQAEGSAL